MTFHYVQILLLTQFWWVTCYSYTFVRDPILFLLGKTERLLKAWFVDKCISVQGMFALLLSGFPITGCVSIVFCNISPYGGAWTCKFLWWFNSGTTYRSFCHNSWVNTWRKDFLHLVRIWNDLWKPSIQHIVTMHSRSSVEIAEPMFTKALVGRWTSA